MPEIRKCRICGLKAPTEEHVTHVKVNCPRCGQHTLTSTASKTLGELSKLQSVKISGWLRDNPGATITQEALPFLESLQMPSLGQKAERILRYLANEYPVPGEQAFVHRTDEIKGVAWIVDDNELHFLLSDYLLHEVGFLNDNGLKISPKGWAYLESLRRGNPESKTAFVAMWFHESVTAAWLAMANGIRSAGYDALRIDQKQHNNKIDDEIVAGIRRSKFLVADFTGHRGGVYFEAGLAMGLGLPVIWLCRHDQLKETHFDTRQYNFIVWEADKLAELSTALQNRIEATIGRGPLQPPM